MCTAVVRPDTVLTACTHSISLFICYNSLGSKFSKWEGLIKLDVQVYVFLCQQVPYKSTEHAAALHITANRWHTIHYIQIYDAFLYNSQAGIHNQYSDASVHENSHVLSVFVYFMCFRTKKKNLLINIPTFPCLTLRDRKSDDLVLQGRAGTAGLFFLPVTPCYVHGCNVTYPVRHLHCCPMRDNYLLSDVD